MIPGSPVVLVNEQAAAGPRTGDAANLRKPGAFTAAFPQLPLWSSGSMGLNFTAS